MLRKLPDHIADCLARAAAAEHRAAEASDLDTRHDQEQIAKSWRVLAASYQFSESLEQFVRNTIRSSHTKPNS